MKFNILFQDLLAETSSNSKVFMYVSGIHHGVLYGKAMKMSVHDAQQHLSTLFHDIHPESLKHQPYVAIASSMLHTDPYHDVNELIEHLMHSVSENIEIRYDDSSLYAIVPSMAELYKMIKKEFDNVDKSTAINNALHSIMTAIVDDGIVEYTMYSRHNRQDKHEHITLNEHPNNNIFDIEVDEESDVFYND